MHNDHLASLSTQPAKDKGQAFCPSNIALCKYWGKRDEALNLPTNSSLSISLGKLGTHAHINESKNDRLLINGKNYLADKKEYQRVFAWIDRIVGKHRPKLTIDTMSNIPTGAGVASSASAFSAILSALNDFFAWHINIEQLAHFARLGSGSAARSLLKGFVYAKAGNRADGTDFSIRALPQQWSEFNMAIVYVDRSNKHTSSKEGMQLTTQTSPIFKGWSEFAEQSCGQMIQAITEKNFTAVGRIAERNALTMHGTMMGCNPPLIYLLPQSLAILQQVKVLRSQGIEVYATLDAGPNVKLIFLEKSRQHIKDNFTHAEIIAPFELTD